MNIATFDLLVEKEDNFDYKILETIQTTSARIIYRGKRNSDGALVSIRKPLDDSVQIEDIIALQNEERIAKRLSIPDIIKPYHLTRYKNVYVSILENIEGQFLDRWLLEREFNLVDNLQIAISLVRVLEKIHQAGIIHKNLQSANIVIDPKTLNVKILDFSFATILNKEVSTFSNAITSARSNVALKETFGYISPEQTGRMNRALDYRSDFYSLGVIFYEIFTGNLPFNTDNLTELIYSHLAAKPISLDRFNGEIPLIVSSIVLKLLSKNAEDRYQTTSGLIVDLQTCLDDLLNRGTIETFTLGKADRSSHLLISQKLYGRDLEIANLTSIVDRICLGEAAFVAVTGYSGIGKTSVVNEIHKSLFAKQGCYITGKFDQLKRNIPYAALIQAFQTLIGQFLIQSPEKIEYWRDLILSSLSNNAKVITDVIPELESIVGIPPEVAQLSPTEARNRFDRVFKDFIRVFARPEHPLVIFLDDLQWADSGSLRAIELLLSDTASEYLLIIGAYRDNEVSPIHPLIKTLEIIETIRPIDYINLQPLQYKDISQLIADTLDCELASSASLAELVFRKTGGNPFFTERLLQTLYAEKLLVFGYEKASKNLSWSWSIEKILAVGITDYDAVELVAQNLQKLPKSTQEILQLAACIGNRFDLKILAIVNQKSQLETANELWSAIQTGTILPLSHAYKIPFILGEETQNFINIDSLQISYKFLHDRVQQAAYSLIPKAQKQTIHLNIGHLLLKQTPETKLEDNIFEIVNQLNFGYKIIVERDEKLNLAKLNLIAGKKAKLATAYGVSSRYLNIALELLPESNYWETYYDLILNLHIEAVETEYLNTNFERAETLSNTVILKAKTLLEKIKVYETKIQYYIAQSQMEQAIDLGMSVLKMLKTNLPKSPQQIHIIIGLIVTKITQGKKSIEALASLPEMKDTYKLAAMRILEAMIPAAFIANPQLFPIIIFKMVGFSLKYGNMPLSIVSYGGYGLIHCAILGDINAGYQYGLLGLKLLERLDAKDRKAQIYLVFNTFIRHWKEHLKESLEPLIKGVQSGLETGNIQDACYCSSYYCNYLFLSGENLETVRQKQTQYIQFLVTNKHKVEEEHLTIWHRAVLNLTDYSGDRSILNIDREQNTQILLSLKKDNNNQAIFSSYLLDTLISFLLKQYSHSFNNAVLARQYQESVLGTAYIPIHNFYYSLTLLALYPTVDRSQQKQYLQQVKSNQNQMEKWAKYCPDNYLHKYELVEAEIARVLGNNDRAAIYYDRSIEHSIQFGYIQEEALALELAAEFYFSLNRKKIAIVYLSEAYYRYIVWGAYAKVKDLEQRYSKILPPERSEVKSDVNEITMQNNSCISDIDLNSVIKASQTISSEIILDKLLYKLMAILMENAGAQKGFLFFKENDSWSIAAEALFEEKQEIVLPYIQIDANSDIPISIINYVQSTKETLILERAYDLGIFVDDAYIVKYKVQSVLAAPILYQNKLEGIIYLENSLLSHVFTKKKLDILNILISQVAISIENARLYDDRDVVKKSLKEKEVLLKEIHHRVKNNLFVVSSLLEFQADYIDDPEVIKMLSNSQNRINSMALVHEHLYGTSDLQTIDFHKYTKALVENLAYCYAAEDKGIEFSLNVGEISLNIETANPCGLIINELISNSLEHAFIGRTSGQIGVDFDYDRDRQIVLKIEDNGIGCPGGLNFYNSDSLGLKLVATLVEQLEGKIQIEQNNGITITITFSELDYASRVN
jgi:predicted ATPase/two-component sensor histidine kinase